MANQTSFQPAGKPHHFSKLAICIHVYGRRMIVVSPEYGCACVVSITCIYGAECSTSSKPASA